MEEGEQRLLEFVEEGELARGSTDKIKNKLSKLRNMLKKAKNV